jgi:hypothetical protein
MIFPNNQDRQVVVFLVGKSLPFNRRLAFGITLLLVGLASRRSPSSSCPASLSSLFGTLLFLVRGYDNRVDFGKFEPDAQWERVASTNSSNWSNTTAAWRAGIGAPWT